MNKEDFSIFNNFYKREGKALRYFDSASTTLSPDCVTDAVSFYYKNSKSSIGRSGGVLAYEGGLLLERVREQTAFFLGTSPSHIAFMSGATQIAGVLVRDFLKLQKIGKDDFIFVSRSLHHALLAPLLYEKEKIGFSIIYGENSFKEIQRVYQEYDTISLLFLDHASNVTGEIYSLQETCLLAKTKGSLTIVDGCQAVLSVCTPLKDLCPTAYFFTGHKMYSHTGIAVLYLSEDVSSHIQTSSIGGGGVEFVERDTFKAKPFPYSYESGSHNMGALVSFQEALLYSKKNSIQETHKKDVFSYAYSKLQTLPGIKIFSPQKNNTGIISFSLSQVHPHDVAYILGEQGIIVRAGFFCSEIYARDLSPEGLVRISLAPYVSFEDVDFLVQSLLDIHHKFSF
jgi:cysteine desulfurase/selenocysteine lyase